VAALTCPDWLLFHTFRDQNLEVYKLSLTGDKALQNISQSTSTDSRPNRSLDSSKIVFQSNRSGTVQLYVVDANGQNLKQLTTIGNNVNAMFNPKATHVVYQSDRNGNWDLFLLDLASGTEKQLTTDSNNDINPYWSPDGLWVTYQSDRTGNDNVLVLNVNTGEEFSVTRGTADSSFPNWSPNGKQLSFLTDAGNALFNLTVSAIDGSGLVTITTGPMDTGNTAWSPEGNRIAYQAMNGDKLDVFTYDLRNSKQYQVTNGEGVNSGPSWDCGGQNVAFTSTRTGSPNVLMSVWTGGEANFLTNDNFTNKWVLWSPTEDNLSSRAH
jgi:Tol biopolymer transport system component